MVTNCWIVNASPLILLGKTGYLHLIADLAGSVVVPSAVVKEVCAKKKGDPILEELKRDERFRISDAKTVPIELLAWDLGAGETEVIALAMQQKAKRVVLDDLEARRCAKVMELSIIGTVGLVARAKRMGFIDSAALVIEQLCQAGLYISEDIVATVLQEVGE